MEIKRIHIIGIISAIVIIAVSFLIYDTRFFLLLIGIGAIAGVLPFVLTIIQESRESTEKEQMFIEFSRNLVESVKAGTPISKSIVNMKDRPYGVLSTHIKKLATQIYLGIPLTAALQIFAKDVDNRTISKAITLIGQAEKSGGEIGGILESVAGAVNTSDKLKKERKAAISTLVAEGYIIFLVFMIIILVMQYKIIPMLSGIQNVGAVGTELGVSTNFGNIETEISSSFLYLIMIQGFFSGLIIGKLSEGNLKAGVKHSFALMFISYMISAGARIIFG
ncbi:type II secretion system F family protein [Candidatus Pacearchaeota archaeon]|nr:type II secretion system F family protein [Candidatus Pacearchaeota archaeon]